MSNRETTQKFKILNILTGHCGSTLSYDKIKEIMDQIETAMRNWPCSSSTVAEDEKIATKNNVKA